MPASRVFSKFESGRLKSGSRKTVTNRKQAIAIYLNEKANEDATGSPDRGKKPIRRKS